MIRTIRYAAFVNGLAVLILGLDRLNVPEGFWVGKTRWVITALIVTVVVPMIQLVINERGERARRQAIEVERKYEALLITTLSYLVRHAGANWEQTGLQVFWVKRQWRQLWFPKYHARVARLRLGFIPSSGTVWTKGKGNIGRCWETLSFAAVDLDAHFAQFNNLQQADWDLLPPETTYGMTYDDFKRNSKRYGFVAAAPILNEQDRYLGCVSLDIPPKRNGGESRSLNEEEVFNALTTAARLVREIR